MLNFRFQNYIKEILYGNFEYRLENYKSTNIHSKKFDKHFKKCQKFYEKKSISNDFQKNIQEFKSKGFTSFNSKISNTLINNVDKYIKSKNFDENINLINEFPILKQIFNHEIEPIIEGIYDSYFYIFYGIISKKIGDADMPKGSQLWHTDGGPGTCINLMIVTSELQKENGALELLAFNESKEILIKMNRELNSKHFYNLNREKRRELKAIWIQNEINNLDISKIHQPTGKPGKVIIFRNNLIHKGGFCQKGKYRNAFIFHLYPANKKLDWDKLKKIGIQKKNPIPIL